MPETDEPRTNFAGTYFDRDSILRLARLADIFAWIVLFFYIAQMVLAAAIYLLQLVRGLIIAGGITDIVQQVLWIFQPALPGLWYFIGIQAIGKALLIFMDMEDNTRRAARK